jgi:hypothetical protein
MIMPEFVIFCTSVVIFLLPNIWGFFGWVYCHTKCPVIFWGFMVSDKVSWYAGEMMRFHVIECKQLLSLN